MSPESKHQMQMEKDAVTMENWETCPIEELSDLAHRHDGAMFLWILRLGKKE